MYYRAVRDSYNISIITHNRPELLQKSIESVLYAVKGRDVPIYVIWQQPDDSTIESTRQVIDKYIDHFKRIEIQQKKYSIPEDNIDAARLKALEIAFLDPSIKYAVVIEDDVCLADDAFDFIESVIAKHGTKIAFRGVNFGSKEVKGSANGYSKNRYGIHGPASVISRKTWKNSGLANFGEKSLPRTWDGYIEPYLKTGFMVTPNLSRYIDFGAGGTHSKLSNKDYFNGLQNSFEVLSKSEKTASEYFHEQILHTWRFDSKAYFPFSNPYYLFRFFLVRMRDHFENK